MNRREMLGSLTSGMWAPTLLSQAASPVEASRHTIDGFEAFRVKVNQRGDWVLLRTRMSSGLTGLGDCSQSGDDSKVLALLDEYQRQLRGRSIFAAVTGKHRAITFAADAPRHAVCAHLASSAGQLWVTTAAFATGVLHALCNWAAGTVFFGLGR